jgi:carboxyl-terminal processing protease
MGAKRHKEMGMKRCAIRNGSLLLLTIILLLVALPACRQADSITSPPSPSEHSSQSPPATDLSFTRVPGSDWPDGWRQAVDPAYGEHYTIVFIADGGPDGEPAFHIDSTVPVGLDDNAGGIFRQMAELSDYRGHRVRLSADIKSEDVVEQAGLWLRVNGEHRVLAFDNMKMNPIMGTNDWQRHEIVLDIPAVDKATVERVVYGFQIMGPGQVWVSNVRLEAVDTDVAVTDMYAYAPEPSNLDFEVVENGRFPGWQMGGRHMAAYVVAADTETVYTGRQSLTISSATAEPDAWATVWQKVLAEPYQGQQIQLTAQVKTSDVTGEVVFTLGYEGRTFGAPHETVTSSALADTADWSTVVLLLDLVEGIEVISFGFQLSGAGQIWVDDVRLEPVGPSDWTPERATADRPQADDLPSDVAAYLNEALDIMETHSLHRDEIDWPTFRAEVVAQAAGAGETADTYEALRLAVELLGDGHSRFLTPEEAAVILGGAAENQLPEAYLVSDRLGYLWLPGYLGSGRPAADQHATMIQSLIAQVDEVEPCGWIIGLRDNGGGNMWPMLAGVGPLLGEGEVGRFADQQGSVGPWIYRNGQAGVGDNVIAQVSNPYRPDLPERPIALLIGANTASSGEAIVIAFHGRPNTRFFGQPTAGLSTSNSPFYLPDAAVLVLTTSVMADRFGYRFGQAIEPDIFVEPVPGAIDETDAVLLEAVVWLQESSLCRHE